MHITKIIHKNSFFNGFFAFLLIPSIAHAGLNKWEDEKGQIHYGDRVPTEYLRKEHSILNEQGVILHTSEPMKTDEELSELQKALDKEIAEKTKRIIAERIKMLRDRVLLDTFTTEADLIIARDARVEAVDSQIALAETLVKNDEIKLHKVEERIEEIEKSGRTPPVNLRKKVLFVGRQIKNNKNYVAEKKAERNKILETFDKDLIRFRELKKARKGSR